VKTKAKSHLRKSVGRDRAANCFFTRLAGFRYHIFDANSFLKEKFIIHTADECVMFLEKKAGNDSKNYT
jgi:hypothetical protein